MSRKIKKAWKIVFLLAVNLAILIIVSTENAQAARLGSSGERVAAIQQKLFEYKLYSGEINGSFDFTTRQSLKKFQSRNNLSPTGETDFLTLRLLGISSRDSDFCIQTELLARFVQHCGGTSYRSMLMTAENTLKNKNGLTLIGYIALTDPDFILTLSPDEPSDEAYSAASQALKKGLLR